MRQLRDLIERFRRPNTGSGGLSLDDAMAAFDAGVSAAESGRHKKAIELFTRAIELAPMTGPMYHHRGSEYAEMGRHEEAIADYDVAVRLNPAYPDTYLDRGNSQHALDHLELAIKDYSEAIRLKPAFAEAYGNRAAVYARMGDEAAANRDTEAAYAHGIDSDALDKLLEQARKKAGR